MHQLQNKLHTIWAVLENNENKGYVQKRFARAILVEELSCTIRKTTTPEGPRSLWDPLYSLIKSNIFKVGFYIVSSIWLF